MKKILFICGLIFSVYANAQLIGWVPYASKNKHIGMAADSLMYMPVKDTTHTPQRLGAYTMRPQDSCVYIGISQTAGTQRWAKLAKYSELTTVGNAKWALGGNTLSSAQTFGTVSNHDLPIITNNIERIRILSTGNFGIGTSTPTSLLHVVPIHTTGIGAEFISSTTTSGTILDITGTSTALAANNEGLNIGISGANGTNGITATGARISVTNTNATSGTNNALELTASGATTQNTALSVAAGDVLIAGMGNFADTTNFKPVVINTTGTAGTSNKLYKATYWPGGGVTGGTFGYVPKWTSATTLSSTSLYDSSGNIGLNTNKPGRFQGAYTYGSAAGYGTVFNIFNNSYDLDATLIVSGSRIANVFIETAQGVTTNYEITRLHKYLDVLHLGAMATSSGAETLADVMSWNMATGEVGIGTGSPSAKTHIISTTEQLRVGYDASNYYSTTVGSTGGVTFNAVGSGAVFNFSDKIGQYNASSPTNGQLLIGHTSNGTFEKATLTAGQNISITNGAGSVTIATDVTLAQGTYTPTLTNTTNITSSTAYTTHYFRVGDQITVWGQVEITPTDVGDCELRMTLPVATSNFNNTYEAAGNASEGTQEPTKISNARILAVTADGKVKLLYNDQIGGSRTFSFSFTYKYVTP